MRLVVVGVPGLVPGRWLWPDTGSAQGGGAGTGTGTGTGLDWDWAHPASLACSEMHRDRGKF